MSLLFAAKKLAAGSSHCCRPWLAYECRVVVLFEAGVNRKVCAALWSKVIPGMLDRFDCPSMIRLFANRPLLIINGENEPNCPIEGAKLAFAAAEEAYRAELAELPPKAA